MQWLKKGLINLDSCLGQGWRFSHAAVPSPILLNDRIRVYVNFFDQKRVSRVGYVDLDIDDPSRVIDFSKEPLLDLGAPGTFDQDGVLQCSVVKLSDSQYYMYYVGFEVENKIRTYFDDNLSVKNVVHVLVEIPPADVNKRKQAIIASTEYNNDVLESMKNRLVRIENKRKPAPTSTDYNDDYESIQNRLIRMKKNLNNERDDVSISKISSEQVSLLQRKITVLWEEQVLKSNYAIEGYNWKTDNEQSKNEERDGYKNYLMNHLNDYFRTNGLYLMDLPVDEGMDLMNTDDKRFPFNLRGGTEDLLFIMDDFGKRYGIHNFVGMRAIIDCKSDVTNNACQYENQAWAKLLVANSKATDHPILVLLTDLNNDWKFFVLGERHGTKGVYRLNCVDPGTGFEVLKQVIQIDLAQIEIMSTIVPIKKIKLEEIIPPIFYYGIR